MNRTLSCLLAVTLLCLAPRTAELAEPAASGAGRYAVEIIVFRNGSALDAASESSTPGPAGITAQPTTTRRLQDSAARMRAAAGYRVIAHTAWTQSPAAWNSRRGVAVSQLGLPEGALSGTVILERGQFLHLGFDLRFNEGGRQIALKEVRRVKSGERQYFDHPNFGVIALVTAGG